MREGLKLLLTFLALPVVSGVLAVLTTNTWFIPAVLFPLYLVAAGLYLAAEPQVEVYYELEKHTAKVGDEIKAKVKIEARRGFGVIAVRAPPIPGTPMADAFEVVGGRNVAVFFKGLRPLREEVEYVLRPVVRGRYSVGAVEYLYINLFGVLKPREGKRELRDVVDVLPRIKVVNRVLGATKPRQDLPRATAARAGPYSTEFRALRRYLPGDPYKFINWKATARSTGGRPQVNEYEREGLRTAVIVLDLGPSMAYGSVEENPLEYGISLSLSLAKALLRYGYNVGLWAIPRGPRIVPSSGSTHYIRILRALLLVKPGASGSYAPDLALRRIVRETKPSLIYITSIDKTSIRDVTHFARQIGGRVLVVDISPDSLLFRKIAAGGKACVKLPKGRIYALLPKNAKALHWDPACEGIGVAVAKITSAMGKWI